MTRRFLVALAVLLACTGCAAAAPPSGPPVTVAAAASSPVAARVAAPTAVRIPAIGVESPPLTRLALDDAGELTVPPLDRPEVAGWFGVRPGEVGPAVVAAHVSGRVDGQPVPGLFAHLEDLAPGDDVFTDHADGTVLRWEVTADASYPKDRFPTVAVYGDEDRPVLHLITCDGALVDGSYLDNHVVYAELVGRA